MTQNDIAYYSAKNERRDMRLKRKETKRHNLATENAQRLSAEANLVGAQASQMSAAAAQQSAATKQREYQLEWESAYGMPYGKDPTNPDNYIEVTNVVTGEKYKATKFPEPITYSQKKADAMEKLYKSAYEQAGAQKQKMETAYGTVRIIREGVGTINDTLNLGSKVKNMYQSYSSAMNQVEPGTDMIVYGGQ